MLHFKNLNFKNKLIWSYVLLILICLIFVLFLSIVVIGGNVKQLMIANVKDITSLSVQNVNNEMEGLVEFSNILYNNKVVGSILSLDHPPSDVEFQQMGINLRNELDNVTYALSGSKIKVIYNDDAPFGGRSFDELLSESEFFSNPALRISDYQDDKLNFAYTSEEDKRYLVLIRTIFDVLDGKRIGKYAVYYDLENIEDILDEISIGENGGLLLADSDGQVIAGGRGQQKISDALANDGMILKMRSGDGIFYTGSMLDDYMFCVETEPRTQLKTVSYMQVSELLHAQNNILLIIILAFILSVLFAVLIGIRLSTILTRPIRTLYTAMRRVEKGDFQFCIEASRYHDETAYLAAGFNKMLEKINHQMAEIKAKERSKRKADIKILYEQINPHFLYNTLDSISWLATSSKEENREKVSEMVTSLSDMLRLGLSKGRDRIEVRDEIAHVKAYINIQQIRYNNSFRVTFDIQEDILSKYVIKILLQPLVENAIMHGFGDMEYDRYIKISGFARENALVFRVEDNGRGGDLEHIRAAISGRQDGAGSRGGFGLYNVQERIHLYCGPEWGITVSQSRLGGLCFTVRVPQDFDLN